MHSFVRLKNCPFICPLLAIQSRSHQLSLIWRICNAVDRLRTKCKNVATQNCTCDLRIAENKKKESLHATAMQKELGNSCRDEGSKSLGPPSTNLKCGKRKKSLCNDAPFAEKCSPFLTFFYVSSRIGGA